MYVVPSYMKIIVSRKIRNLKKGKCRKGSMIIGMENHKYLVKWRQGRPGRELTGEKDRAVSYMSKR